MGRSEVATIKARIGWITRKKGHPNNGEAGREDVFPTPAGGESFLRGWRGRCTL